MSNKLPLRYLNEPILDAGLSAILIMSDKKYPEELTYTDWVNCLEKIKEHYMQDVLKEYIKKAFTLNGYINNSWKNLPSNREAKIREVFSIAMYGKNGRIVSKSPEPVPPDGELCAFYKNEAADIYVARDRYPLLPRRDNINLTPNGEGYLAISKWAFGCVLASIFVAPIVKSKLNNKTLTGLFYVNTFDEDMMFKIHKMLYDDYIKPQINIIKEGGKVDDYEVSGILSKIHEIIYEEHEIIDEEEDELTCPITFYYISNDSKSPFSYTCSFTSNLTMFLRHVNTPEYKIFWSDFIKDNLYDHYDPYDYMFNKHNDDSNNSGIDNTMRFVSGFIEKFFLQYSLQKAKKCIKSNGKIDVKSRWALLELLIKTFFRGKPIDTMKNQMEIIKSLADRLADAVEKDVHKNLFKKILGFGGTNINKYKEFTDLLLKVSIDYFKKTGESLITTDEYEFLFIKSREEYAMNWLMIRNMIIIAFIEKLSKDGYSIHSKEEENSDIDYDRYDV